MRPFMLIAKALADESRVRVLMALRDQELCVCQITALFGLSMSTVSKHLSILNHAGLVNSRKLGRWIYYRLPAPDASPAARQAIDWVFQSVHAEPRILEDERQLRKILKMDPVELCKSQCKK
jgi:DNA-binding transcriptional ArsR family regulator